MRQTRSLRAGCLAVALLGAAAAAAPRAGEPAPHRPSLRRAPDFEFRDINPRSASHGRSLSLAELYAETGVVLNFIASWCEPCWPELESFQRLAADGLPLVCIAADEYGPTGDLLRKAAQVGLSVPILHVPRERIQEMEALYDHAMLPATYVIDPSGGVRDVFLGAVPPAKLLESVRAAWGQDTKLEGIKERNVVD